MVVDTVIIDYVVILCRSLEEALPPLFHASLNREYRQIDLDCSSEFFYTIAVCFTIHENAPPQI